MKIPRRAFVRRAAMSAGVLSFPTILPRHVYGGTGVTPPSERIRLGMVGVGGQGRHNTEQFLAFEDVQIAALADPAEHWDLSRFYYESEAGRRPVAALIEEHYARQGRASKVAAYVDFREMLAEEKDLDAVVCSTPDHSHAFVTAAALRAGKHVYCEKPLTHNLWELREIVRLARESGLATQLGNAGHSSEGMRRTVEIVRSGLLGTIREASAWSFGSRWNLGLEGLPTGTPDPPAGLDWDRWIGPREHLPYHPAYVPVTWRDFWRFGTGSLGDFGCHDLDALVWAFNLSHPASVEVIPGGFPVGNWNPEIIPYSEVGYFRFEESGAQAPLDLTWYSGSLRPSRPPFLPAGFDLADRGIVVIGERGVVQSDGAGRSPRVFPRAVRAEATEVPKTLPRSSGHHRDWLTAIRGGPAPSASFENTAALNEIVLLGVLSLRLAGRRIGWDPETLEVPGVPEAGPLIREPVRAGWELS